MTILLENSFKRNLFIHLQLLLARPSLHQIPPFLSFDTRLYLDSLNQIVPFSEERISAILDTLKVSTLNQQASLWMGPPIN